MCFFRMGVNRILDQFPMKLILAPIIDLQVQIIEWGQVELSSGLRDQICAGIKMALPRGYLALWPDLSLTGKAMIPDSILRGGYLIPIHANPSSHLKKGTV